MIDWGILPTFILDGLFLGSYYGLLALGVSIIFGVLDVGDVSQGGLFAVGSYLTYTVVEHLGLSYFLTPLIVVPLTAFISIILGTLVYRKLRNYGIAPTFLGSVSLLIIIQSLVAMIYGERVKTVGSPFVPRMIDIGSSSIFTHKIFIVVATALLALLVWYLLWRTKWGRGVRAVSQNREAASLAGVNLIKTMAIAFAISGSLAGLAGFLTAPVYTFTPFTGRFSVLKAFVISRIAMGSVPGVLALALMVGIAESLTSAYFLGEFSNLIPFVLLILITLVRPDVLGPEEKHRIRRRVVSGVKLNLPSGRSFLWLIGVVAILIPVLFDIPSYVFHLAITVGTAAIAVTSLDLLYGYVGLPSLAQGAFFGVGAYTSAILTSNLSGSVLIGFSGGIAVCLLLGLLVGLIGVRTGRHWTSFTFISTIVFTILFTNLDSLTGGPSGISGVPILSLGLPGLGGVEFNPFLGKKAYYILVVMVLLTVLVFKYLLLNSWFGRSIRAIREDEGLGRSIGIPTNRYKVVAFGISASIAGLAGSLYGHYVTFLHPELFNFVTSFRFLMMNRIGGLGSLLGPVVGSTALTVVDELTHPLNSYLSEILFSGTLVISLIYFPEGLVGIFKKGLAFVLPRKFVKTGGGHEDSFQEKERG